MRKGRAAPAFLALLLLGACQTGGPMKGSTADGEVFTGVTFATGFYDLSGSIQLTSNRGRNCVGQYVFAGGMVPSSKGTATFSCSNGDSGTAVIEMYGANSGTGQGTLGSQPFTFKWGTLA